MRVVYRDPEGALLFDPSSAQLADILLTSGQDYWLRGGNGEASLDVIREPGESVASHRSMSSAVSTSGWARVDRGIFRNEGFSSCTGINTWEFMRILSRSSLLIFSSWAANRLCSSSLRGSNSSVMGRCPLVFAACSAIGSRLSTGPSMPFILKYAPFGRAAQNPASDSLNISCNERLNYTILEAF